MKRTLALLGVALLLAGGACATTGPVEPPPWTVGFSAATTERMLAGRSLYSSRCQRCHALPAPSVKTPEGWPAEVASMSRKSGLSAEQATLISDYLVAASRAARGPDPVATTTTTAAR